MMKKRILSIMLVFMMLFSTVSFTAYANDSTSGTYSNGKVKTLDELAVEKECLVSLIELTKATLIYEYETAVEKCETDIEAYCDRVDEQIDDLEWDLIGKPYNSTSEFNSLYSSYNNEIMTLKRKISALMGDNSSSGRSQRARLEAQLEEVEAKRDELLEYRSIENRISALKNEKKSYENSKKNEIAAYERLIEDDNGILEKTYELIDNAEENNMLERYLTAVSESSIRIDGSRIYESDAENIYDMGMAVKNAYNKSTADCLEYLTYKIENHEEDGHIEYTVVTKANFSKDGKVITKCKVCGESLSSKAIYRVKTVKLSKTKYIYNGKMKTPSVIVKDSKGNTISSKNYTLTKPSGRKNVGKYTYKIKFKNQYSGSKTLYLTINPKAPTIKKPIAAKKAITVKWSKISKQASGYEIMIATNSKFTKGKKTVKVTSYKTTSKKITKLSSKKTYYVKIRTYKTVDGKKYYSDWSKYKTVKVR